MAETVSYFGVGRIVWIPRRREERAQIYKYTGLSSRREGGPKPRKAGLAVVFATSLLLCGVAVCALAAEQKADPSDAKAAIRRVVQGFVTAWNKNDTDTLTNLFTRDERFTSPRGANAEGQLQIKKLLTQEHRDIYKGTTLVATVDQITFPREGGSVATGSYTLKGVDVAFGIEVSPQGSFAFRFTRREVRWLIASARIFKQ